MTMSASMNWSIGQVCTNSILFYFQSDRLQELKKGAPFFQYQLLPQTTHGIFHSMKDTAEQFKVSDTWFKCVLCPNISLLLQEAITHVKNIFRH